MSEYLPSHFQIGDMVWIVDGTNRPVDGVVFTKGKVHYVFNISEDQRQIIDSCDVSNAPIDTESVEL